MRCFDVGMMYYHQYWCSMVWLDYKIIIKSVVHICNTSMRRPFPHSKRAFSRVSRSQYSVVFCLFDCVLLFVSSLLILFKKWIKFLVVFIYFSLTTRQQICFAHSILHIFTACTHLYFLYFSQSLYSTVLQYKYKDQEYFVRSNYLPDMVPS